MKISIRFVACMILGAIQGCASVPDVPTVRYTPPQSSKELVTLYFLRNDSMPTRLTARILVNGKKLALLPDNSFTWVQVSPGQLDIGVEFNPIAMVKSAHLQIATKGSESYFVRYAGSIEEGATSQLPIYSSGKFIGMSSTSPMKERNELRTIDAREGSVFLAAFSYVVAQVW